jgi:type IV pilus assembly protein PilQ
MKRQAILLLAMTGLTLGAVCASATGTLAASPQATLKAVTISNASAGTELLLRMEGACAFRTVHDADDTLLIDLQGARAGEIPKMGQWPEGALTGYRLLHYTDAAGQPVVRVQITARQPGAFTVRQEAGGLHVLFEQKTATRAASSSAPATVAAAEVAGAHSAPAPLNTSAPGPVKVSDVSIKPGNTGETFVDVATSSTPTFHVTQLKNPKRLVVDIEEARNVTQQKLFAAQSSVLKDVRIAQFRESRPAVVRVVADLAGDPVFDVHPVPGGVRIELRTRELAKALKTSSPAQVSESAPQREAAPASPPVEVAIASPSPASQAVSSEPAPPPAQAAASTVAPSASPLVGATAPDKDVPKVDYQSALPGAPESSQAAAAPVSRRAAPNQTPEALQAEKAARTLAAVLPASLGEAQGTAPGGAGQAAQQPQYTGEPISLNLKDVDLKDFFRLIHEISGLNLIVDPNVTGSVTIVLEQVPWDQALDIVLKNNGLGKVLEGTVLRIARLDTLTAEQTAAKTLAAAREEAQPLVTVYRTINYAKPETIATMIKSLALSKRGNILVDARTSTLIISDIQSQIPLVDSAIARLDKKAKQVLIEARVILATTSFSRSLTVALAPFYQNRATQTGATSSGGGVSATAQGGYVGLTPPIVTTPPAASGYGAFAIYNQGARYFIDAAIAAAETRQQARTISRPSIITQNNSMGTVVQGTQIPIQTVIGTTVATQMTTAALTLSVTPQVTEDGNVFLNISVQNNSPGATVATGTGASVTINTQQATTNVLVPDGGTVVFGGVTVTTRSTTENGVPLLDSIPILGHLFKSTSITDSDNELLFFVSPKILPA